MRDRLGASRWANNQFANPTQNMFRQFVKTPHGEFRSMFMDVSDRLDKLKRHALERKWEIET